MTCLTLTLSLSLDIWLYIILWCNVFFLISVLFLKEFESVLSLTPNFLHIKQTQPTSKTWRDQVPKWKCSWKDFFLTRKGIAHIHMTVRPFLSSPYHIIWTLLDAVWAPACNMIHIRQRWGTRCQRRTWRQGHAPKFDRYVAGLEGLCFERVKLERKVMSR